VPEPRQYKTAGAFRQSLEERLNQISQNQRIDLARLRRRVAFERLLARLFADENPSCLLKGGYAIELRLDKVARATKDIDLTIRNPSEAIPGGMSQPEAIREWLQDKLEKDLNDWFVFRLGEQTNDLQAAPFGGARIHVEARLDNRTFAEFNLDVGLGDAVISAPEWVTGHELLSFAGIPPARIALLPLDQQFAEKIHAYTVPRAQRINSRVRDLIDLVLLIENGLPSTEQVVRALHATFNRRATHPLPIKLEPPPENWRGSYAAMAAEHAVRHSTMEVAYEYVATYWDQLGVSQENPEQPPRKRTSARRRKG